MSFSALAGKPSRRISARRRLRTAGDGPLRCRHFGLPTLTLHSQSKAAITVTPVSSCLADRVSQPFWGPLPNGDAPHNLDLKKVSIFWHGALVQAGRCGSFSRCPLRCAGTMHSKITTAAQKSFSHLRNDIVLLRFDGFDIMPAQDRRHECLLHPVIVEIHAANALATLTLGATHPGTRFVASYLGDSQFKN